MIAAEIGISHRMSLIDWFASFPEMDAALERLREAGLVRELDDGRFEYLPPVESAAVQGTLF